MIDMDKGWLDMDSNDAGFISSKKPKHHKNELFIVRGLSDVRPLVG
jgi:hypothetical protein